MKMKHLLSILLFLSIVGWGPITLFSPIEPIHIPKMSDAEDDKVKVITAQASNLNPKVLKLGLTAYEKARSQGKDTKEVLTIIDYSKPSSERRLWVVDMKHNKVLFNTFVAHGKNSGQAKSTSFSNQPKSLKSSFGVFETEETYTGHEGYSMRIQGLEHGLNDNVYRRKVVFHGADYVSEHIAKVKGMVGRSWGCMAVSRQVIKPLINTIKNKTLVVAYYPDNHWLKHSTYLT